MIALYILGYLWVGFIAARSPFGQYVGAKEPWDLPPLMLMTLWPVVAPVILISAACEYLNNQLKKFHR